MHAQTTISEPSTVHATFVIERAYAKSPEQVFAAFSDPVKKRRWFAEGRSHTVERFEMDFRVDGLERIETRYGPGTPIAGMTIINQGRYQDITPDRRIVISQTMDLDDRRISAALVTIELLRTETGTNLVCTHQGTFFEGADGPQMREGGWRQLFEKLAQELAR